MKLSRKRQRELKKLRRGASELWDNQKEVLDHATKVVKEASRQLANVSREEVAPRVRNVYESRVRPTVESGWDSGRNVVGAARDKFSHDIVPAVSSALGTALAALEVAKSRQVREAIMRVARPLPKSVVPAKRTPGPARYILIGVGIVAAAGIAYAAWQTLRADDELWVTDETDSELSE